MKKLYTTILFITIVFLFGCNDNSIDSESELTNINLSHNQMAMYEVYEIDLLTGKLGVNLSQEEVYYEIAYDFQGKLAYYYSLIELEKKKTLFSNIYSDNEYIYLYIPELNINKIIPENNLDSNLSRFTPGWIKIYDFSSENWVANELSITHNNDIDTVVINFSISGKKEGSS